MYKLQSAYGVVLNYPRFSTINLTLLLLAHPSQAFINVMDIAYKYWLGSKLNMSSMSN